MKTYTLTTKAYGEDAGATVELNPDDPLVRLNVAAGILVEGKAPEVGPEKMTCPLCRDDLDMKRPPKLDNPDELAQHYEDKHPGFAVPAWSADTERGDEK